MDDGLEGVVYQLAVDEEPEVALEGGLPLGDRGGIGLLLPFLGLVPGVQLHGDRPHLLHEPHLGGGSLLPGHLHRPGRENHQRAPAPQRQHAGAEMGTTEGQGVEYGAPGAEGDEGLGQAHPTAGGQAVGLGDGKRRSHRNRRKDETSVKEEGTRR